MPADLVDVGHRFEAWTDPNVATFARKFDLSRHVASYTIADKFSSTNDGEIQLPPDFLKRDLLFKVDKANHANDVASIIRVLDGTTPILHYVLKKVDGRWSSTGQTISGKLEGMDYFLDKTLVPNFDAPTKPYIEPDWNYGLPSILYNTDFEDTGFTNLAIHVWLEDTVTAGTWTMTFDAQTTSALAWNIDLPALQTAIEALSNIQDISISGAGTETNPWAIQVIDPAGTDFNVSVDSTGLTGGSALMLSMVQGGAGITDPWTRSFNPITGEYHGIYFNFEISTAQAHTGTQSLYVKGALGAWPESYPGAQQIITATGGRLYRDSFWVYPLFARRYRFGLRSTDETWIADAEADLLANQWQEIKFPATVPTHLRQVIFRIACISNTDGHEFYVDDALFAPGMDAATYGKIMGQLLAACQAAGYLTWVTKTWTDTHDSAGVVWDRDLVWSVRHRQSLLQLVEYADRWNYESDGIHWSIANSRFEWGLYNPSGGGANLQNTGFAVIGKIISDSGTVSEERPDATQFYAEGDLGYWNEFSDATLDGAWGPLQKSFFNGQSLDTAGLLELATRLVADAGGRTEGLVTRLQAAPVKPWIDFKPGDRNVMVNLLPLRPREYKRSMAIIATKGPGDSTPTYDVHWGSVVYQGEAAVLETVRRLVRKFEAARPTTHMADATPTVPIPPPATSAAIEDASWVFAHITSTAADQVRADQVCTGVDDEITIRDAILANLPIGGQVGFLPGRYKFTGELTNADATGNNVNAVFDQPLRFRGSAGVVFEFAGNPAASSYMFRCGATGAGFFPHISFDHITFVGSGFANADGVLKGHGVGDQARFLFSHCDFAEWAGDNITWGERQFFLTIGDSSFESCTPTSSFFHLGGFSAGLAIIHDNNFSSCSGPLWSGAGFTLGGIIHDNNFSGGMTIPAADPWVDVHHNRLGSGKVPGDHDGISGIDHGGLSGLGDDDHPQYLLTSGARKATLLDVDGITGATADSRYVGATASGAPVSGTFAIGDYIVDRSGTMWVCTTAGTPGTWDEVGGAAGTDTDAIHDNVAAEIDALTQVTPAAGDWVLIEDASDANNKKKAAAGDFFGSGTDPDAIHDNVAGEISVITEKVAPVSGDWLLIEDSAASNAKKKVQVGNLPSGGVVPDVLLYPYQRVTGETAHAADDFFSTITGYTEVDITGTTTWSATRGGASSLFAGQSANDFACLLKAVPAAGVPITIETQAVNLFRRASNPMLGLVFTDGTIGTSNLAAFGVVASPSTFDYYQFTGTITSVTASLLSPQEPTGADGSQFMRLCWAAANTFGWSLSPDTENWVDFGQADLSTTFTPTHMGFFVSAWGASDSHVASFRYLRVYEADLSV